jgi:DNA replication protein DnaC
LNFLRDIQSLQKKNLATSPDEAECPLCDGYGYIVTDADVQICSCLKQRQLARQLKRANIPARYLTKTLDGFKADIDSRRLALRQVRRFVQEFDLSLECPGLFLYGAPGTGKTHLAVGALKELIERGYSGLFYNMVSLVQDFRKQAGGNLDDEEETRLSRLHEVDVLVLDDLGAGRLNDFVQEQTYALIDKRYSNNRCVVVTSNLGLRKLEEQITYPVLSRVRGMCFTVNSGDLDFRNPDLQPPPRK